MVITIDVMGTGEEVQDLEIKKIDEKKEELKKRKFVLPQVETQLIVVRLLYSQIRSTQNIVTIPNIIWTCVTGSPIPSPHKNISSNNYWP